MDVFAGHHCPCRQGFDSSVGCFRRPHCLFIGFHQCKQVADAGRARSHSAHNAGDPCHKNSNVPQNTNTNRLLSTDYLGWMLSDKYLIMAKVWAECAWIISYESTFFYDRVHRIVCPVIKNRRVVQIRFFH